MYSVKIEKIKNLVLAYIGLMAFDYRAKAAVGAPCLSAALNPPFLRLLPALIRRLKLLLVPCSAFPAIFRVRDRSPNYLSGPSVRECRISLHFPSRTR